MNILGNFVSKNIVFLDKILCKMKSCFRKPKSGQINWKLCFSCNEFFVKYQKNKPEIRAPHLNLALLRIIEFGGDLDLRFLQVVLTPKTGLCQ